MPDMDKVKDRIRKLLNLADDDAAADGEITNALRFARDLMLKHSLDENDVRTAEEAYARMDAFDASAEEYTEATAQSTASNLSAWESHLCHVIERLIGTVGVYLAGKDQARTKYGTVKLNRQGRPKSVSKVVFYGPAADARDAAELWREWAETISAMGVLKFGGAYRGPGRSYCGGFVSGMAEKVVQTLKAEQVRLEAPATSTALVVLQNALEIQRQKKEHGKVWLKKEKGIKLRSGGRSTSGYQDGGAYSAGKADGRRSTPTRTATKKLR